VEAREAETPHKFGRTKLPSALPLPEHVSVAKKIKKPSRGRQQAQESVEKSALRLDKAKAGKRLEDQHQSPRMDAARRVTAKDSGAPPR
jgi:hypothetical protein